MSPRNRFFASLLITTTLSACDQGEPRDGGDFSDRDEAALSDYDALLEGAPGNEELPFDIKADGPAPIVHTDLIALQSPVKSQGKRGVCSIFSTAALMEHLYIVAGDDDADFSEQYLQWSAKFEVGSFPNTSGSNAFYNLRAITQFGVPAEEAWPYETTQWNEFDDEECAKDNEDKPTRCYTNGAPPQEALDAEKFSLPSARWLNSSRESIMDHMRVNGTAVVVGMDFFYQSWNHRKSTLPRNLDNWDMGVVLYPNADDVEESHKQRAGHSILLVGWDSDLEIPIVDAEGDMVIGDDGLPVVEKGFFIFKNSWGTSGFGIDNPHGAGYGYISMNYIEDYGSARVAEAPELDLPPPGDDDDDDDDDGTVDTFTSDELVSIPDDDPAGAFSEITVDTTGVVEGLSVSVDIEHTWRGDLVVALVKDGEEVILHDRTGGGSDDLVATFDVDDFEGMEREGTWTLVVEDTAGADIGHLRSWTLTIR